MSTPNSQQLPNRILIPATQLTFLNFLYPNLRVYEISGAGGFSGAQTSQQFPFGITFTGIIAGKASIAWRADALINSMPLADILQALQGLATVGDAVIDSVTFYERVTVHEQNNVYHFALKFEKGNIHPQIMRSLVIDGSIPLGGTYAVLLDLKRDLMTLPRESRKHWKPGYLILTDIMGYTDGMLDINLVFSIMEQRFPRSLLVTDAVRNWDLKDYESILGLRRARPT